MCYNVLFKLYMKPTSSLCFWLCLSRSVDTYAVPYVLKPVLYECIPSLYLFKDSHLILIPSLEPDQRLPAKVLNLL